MTVPDASRQLLRHTLATLAYRGGKAVRGAPASFRDFRAFETTRTPGEILAHIGDLLDWALSLADGKQTWHDSSPLSWEREVERFFAALERLEACVASGCELHVSPEKLFQGPIADAFTHVGQINLLRRVAGIPVRGENYYVAEITVGRVGREQPTPQKEFD